MIDWSVILIMVSITVTTLYIADRGKVDVLGVIFILISLILFGCVMMSWSAF